MAERAFFPACRSPYQTGLALADVSSPSGSPSSPTLPTVTTPPRADRRPQPRSHHGDTFADPYEWLRDKENPEVIAHLEAENRYTDQQTGHLDELTEAVFGEIKARTKETDLSVPSYASHRGEIGRASCRERV